MGHLQSNDYAVVVGIDHYPNNQRHLQGAIRDAERFATWLTNRETGGGLPDDNCIVITSDPDPMAVHTDRVDDALAAIRRKIRDAGDDARRLYLFFSGHGQIIDSIGAEIYNQALCLPRWSYELPDAAINVDSYASRVQRCWPFKEIVMFLDCCRTSAIKARARSTIINCDFPRDGHDDVDRLVFYAAEPDKEAFENLPENGADPDQDDWAFHGYFTRALIEKLERGSNRPDGGVDARTLSQYLQVAVQGLAQDNGRSQKPRNDPKNMPSHIIFGAAKEGANVSDAETPGASNFEIRFSDWRVGRVELVDPNLEVVKAGEPTDGSWRLHLKQQRYRLRDLSEGDVFDFNYTADKEGRNVTF